MKPSSFLSGCVVLAIATFLSPAAAQSTLYNVDFEGFTAGTPLPSDSSGEFLDRPSSIDTNLTATVENSATVPEGTPTVNLTKFARLRESCGEAPNLAFDSGVALSSGIGHVGVDVLFENLESYQIVFRNGSGSGIPGPASQTIADIDTSSNGTMSLSSISGTSNIAYQAGVPIRIDAYFDLDNDRWYAFVNGDRIVNGAAILNSPLGFVGIGFNFTSFCPSTVGFDGAMQFDNFLFRQVAAIPGVTPAATIANVLPGVGRPFGVAVHQGYAYVADPESHTVWKVNLSDATDKTPVAGIGWNADVDPQDWQGYNGDGIEATQAQLDNPSGVAVDSSGNVYIADTGNHAIRKIAAGSSFITTVAGIPTSYAVGESTALACHDSESDLTQCVPATNLRLFGPRALAVDEDDDLYIVDRMNQQVKKLYTSGSLSGLIFVVAGVAGYPGDNDGPAAGPAFCTIDECTPAARLNSPLGVAVDGEGIVYIADEGNNRIRRVTLGGNVSTVQASPLLRPTGVAVSPGGGTLYIADYGNHRIRRATECSGEGCTVVTVAGTGTPGSSGGIGDPATSVQLNSPISLSLDGNLLYIADMLNGRILAGDFTPPVILLK